MYHYKSSRKHLVMEETGRCTHGSCNLGKPRQDKVTIMPTFRCYWAKHKYSDGALEAIGLVVGVSDSFAREIRVSHTKPEMW